MTIHSMHDLLVHELRDLYDAEQQLATALPAMTTAAASEALAAAFRDHAATTDEHVLRLETCLTMLGEEPRAIKCKAMEGLLKEGADMLEEDGNPLVRDVGLIGAAQRVEHYEIAAYGTCVELAGVLGEQKVADLLQLTLNEEYASNLRLSEIAATDVNPRAMPGATVVS